MKTKSVSRFHKSLCAVAVSMAAMTVSAPSMAEVSYNVGFASEYYYRGILQKESSASGGIDYESSGFYAGTWAADVGDGLEVDLYFGYGIETENGFTASIGATGYYYTGEFDDTYEEINLNFGYGIASLEYSFGEWDGFGDKQDYDFLALTLEQNGFYGTVGTFGDDFSGDYLEAGYGFSIADIDAGISVIISDKDLSDQLDSSSEPTGSEALVFSLSKSF